MRVASVSNKVYYIDKISRNKVARLLDYQWLKICMVELIIIELEINSARRGRWQVPTARNTERS